MPTDVLASPHATWSPVLIILHLGWIIGIIDGQLTALLSPSLRVKRLQLVTSNASSAFHSSVSQAVSCPVRVSPDMDK